MKWIIRMVLVVAALMFFSGGAAVYIQNLSPSEREVLTSDTTATINGLALTKTAPEGQGSDWWGIAWRLSLLFFVVPVFGALLRKLYVEHGRTDTDMEEEQ